MAGVEGELLVLDLTSGTPEACHRAGAARATDCVAVTRDGRLALTGGRAEAAGKGASAADRTVPAWSALP